MLGTYDERVLTWRGSDMATSNVATKIPVEGGEILGIRIGLDPHRPGLDRVRLLDYGVPLWALVAHLQGVGGDVAQTASDYEVPTQAVRAAQHYYEAHPEYIDAFLLLNRGAFKR
jgi:hypothetical protein